LVKVGIGVDANDGQIKPCYAYIRPDLSAGSGYSNRYELGAEGSEYGV
jgi:hypothetical protein